MMAFYGIIVTVRIYKKIYIYLTSCIWNSMPPVKIYK